MDHISDSAEISDDSEHTALQTQFTAKSRPQIIASLIATTATFCSGTVLGWTSTVNPQLAKNGTDIGTLTATNLSWIASIAVVGALISGFVAGYAIDKIGRKKTLILLVIPFELGWILVASAVNLEMILAGRFFTGFCCGAYTLAVPVYISEITQDRLRGSMSSCMVVSLVIGILFSYILGAFVTWRWLSIVSAIFPVIFAAAALFLPDSPRYLITKGMQDDAAKSLCWLRGASSIDQIDEELKDMTHIIEENSKLYGSWRDLFVLKTMKPIGICLMLMVFQQFGGINAVIFFTVDIFGTSGTDINPNLASIIVGATQVVFVIIATLLVDRLGRKILMFISETGMTFSLMALGTFFYLKSKNDNVCPEGLGWLPLVSMIIYIITYNLGCASLPWTYMGELCPSHVKGAASALVTSTSWFLAFVVTYTFADLKDLIGAHSVFWIFGSFSACGALFSILILPETKGKSLEEIQRLF